MEPSELISEVIAGMREVAAEIGSAGADSDRQGQQD